MSRPILFLPYSVNQRLPSDPVAIVIPPLLGGSGNSVMAPVAVMRPILLLWNSVNHKTPSGPAPMPLGPLVAVGTVNSVMAPAVVMRPILFFPFSVNQRCPSGPAAMPCGLAPAVGIGNPVASPAGVMRPISFVRSMNQTFPSDPQATSSGSVGSSSGSSKSIWGGAGPPITNCAILASRNSVNQRCPSGPGVIP